MRRRQGRNRSGRPFNHRSLVVKGRLLMSRVSLFNSPLLLGFDHFERALDRVSKASAEGYPPYNVEQVGENRLRITLAVAGFAAGELSVQIEDDQLVIRGKQADQPERVYLHRGIAARQFQRSFVLAEGIEVTGANLENGLLHIDLHRPEARPKSRTIAIASAETQAQSVLDQPHRLATGPAQTEKGSGDHR
jgi:HSP20 family molecular chaperone IbpA